MKEYQVTLSTKIKIDIETIKQFIWKTHQMGYSFKESGVNIIFPDVISLLLKNNLEGTYRLEKDPFYFETYILSNSLALEADLLFSDKFGNFEYGEAPLWILREFLKLTDSWLLRFINVTFDICLFYNLLAASAETSNTEDWNVLYGKHLIKNTKGIHAYVTLDYSEKSTCGLRMMTNLAIHGYHLITDPLHKQIIDSMDAGKEFEKTISSTHIAELYLLVEDWVMKLTFNGPLLSLNPLGPIKMKTVENDTDIDIAFYLTIYLNLINRFGIEGLLSTFH